MRLIVLMNTKVLRFGIVGCGVAANFHVKALGNFEDTELYGVYDAYKAGAESFAQKYGVKVYESFEEMLSDENIDAVTICTPSGLHAEQAIKAIRANKHVLIEKPLATEIEDAEKVYEEAKKYNKIVDVVAQLRLSKSVRRIKKALTEERLGKITLVELQMVYYRSDEYYNSAPWRGTFKMDGGGAMMNQGIHGMDLLLYLFGPAENTFGFAETAVRKIETEDTAAAVIKFKSGALCTVSATTSVYPGSPRRLRICGTKGTIVLTEDSISEWSVMGEDPDKYVRESHYTSFDKPEAIPESAHNGVVRDFADAILKNREPVSTAKDGYNAVSLIKSIYKASKEKNIQIPEFI
ncbi:MAG: Gfo/Idh/MocA family oxidoreductase [Ruminococcaceae bacterium]|nr:Gfo/Idh/MocA family oxidoreductase [Oscillospiraceae bacterium]